MESLSVSSFGLWPQVKESLADPEYHKWGLKEL